MNSYRRKTLELLLQSFQITHLLWFKIICKPMCIFTMSFSSIYFHLQLIVTNNDWNNFFNSLDLNIAITLLSKIYYLSFSIYSMKTLNFEFLHLINANFNNDIYMQNLVLHT